MRWTKFDRRDARGCGRRLSREVVEPTRPRTRCSARSVTSDWTKGLDLLPIFRTYREYRFHLTVTTVQRGDLNEPSTEHIMVATDSVLVGGESAAVNQPANVA